ncbi:unnamed protein product [marine sediment metagenome]|uniref:Phenylalanyl tRNA synthetase beta chain core domain-containing protein n=1 Tax=marine sediment metagenome TaxID=412755 RepID=X1FZ63_9ZZZZ
MDSIPTPASDRRGKYSLYQKTIKDIRQALCDIGLVEVINYSFISAESLKKFKINLEEEKKVNYSGIPELRP